MNRPERKFLFNPIFLAGIICLFLLSGCGDSNMFESLADDDTSDAQISMALDAINSDNYDAAIAILEGLDTSDPEVKKYLASAYIGSTGFDTLKLIETMGEDADNDLSSTDGGIFKTVNELLGFQDGTIDLDILDSKIETAAKALELLAPTGTEIGSLSDEDQFQAGLYAAVQTIYVAERILEGQDPQNLDSGTINTLVTENFDANADTLERSLDLVVAAKESLVDNLSPDPTETNDVKDALDEFLTEIGYDDEALSSTEFATYITNQSIQ
jgi:hypothetical protein